MGIVAHTEDAPKLLLKNPIKYYPCFVASGMVSPSVMAVTHSKLDFCKKEQKNSLIFGLKYVLLYPS